MSNQELTFYLETIKSRKFVTQYNQTNIILEIQMLQLICLCFLRDKYFYKYQGMMSAPVDAVT